MTVAINLSPEQEAELKTLAKSKEDVSLLQALAKAEAFRAWAESHTQDKSLLSDEAVSRESIYGERG